LVAQGDKEIVFKGVSSQSRAIDLMVLDILEGLPIPRVFVSSSIVLLWKNIHL